MFKSKKINLKSRKFLAHIFISLLLTGIIPVILLGGFTTIFSSKIMEDTYREQSRTQMKLLVEEVNNILQYKKETLTRLADDNDLMESFFSEEQLGKDDLSKLYKLLYREIQGNIDDSAIHLVRADGTKSYSTHILPTLYNPNLGEEVLSTYLKTKPNRDQFPVVYPFNNPQGDKVAFSLFQKIQNIDGKKGFIILDINNDMIGDSVDLLNTSFFSNLFIIDRINLKYINLLRDYSSGDFTGDFTLLQNLIPKGKTGILKYEGTLIKYDTLLPDDFMLVGTIKYDYIKANMSVLTRIILLITIVGLLISSIVAYALAKNITRPVTKLSNAMKRIEMGEFSTQVADFKEDEFEKLFHGFNRMSSQIKTLLDARVEREKALRTAERLALQSQINPHFLYNTLNTVKAISKLNNVPEITMIITELGRLLRDSIDSQEEFTTVGESLKLVEAYLKIQKIRYGENFNWVIKNNPKLDTFPIPRLIIQPIVENSVIHGLENLIDDKFIEIICHYDPPVITIKDNGIGMTQEIWNQAVSGGKGVGLHNVYRRLKLYYGDIAYLSYERSENISYVNIHL